MSTRKLVVGMAVVGFALIATSAPLSTTANESAVAPSTVTLEQIVAKLAPADGSEAVQPGRQEFVGIVGEAMNVVMAQINRKDAPVVAPTAPVAAESATDEAIAE